VLVAAVVLKLGLHVFAAVRTPYEFHRDEFLYFAMGAHLHLWRMDFPPFMALLTQAMRATMGIGLVAVRIAPAIASTVLVVFSILTARSLGGRRFAQALAALCIIASPAFLRSGSLFQPVVFDQLTWTLALFGLLQLARTENPRWWILIGLAGGLGLLIKFSIGIIAVGIALGLVIPPARRWLATRWPYAAVLIAIVIGSPSIVGQIRTGWPAILYARELSQQQLTHVTTSGFLMDQVQMLGVGIILAIAGMWTCLRVRPLRTVGVACLGALAVLLVMHGKSYYVVPIYPVLLGVGAATIERATARLPHATSAEWLGTAARAMLVLTALVFGVFALPFGLPILPPITMARYAAAGPTGATTSNTDERLVLPQDYADMRHWRERTAAVAAIYHALPPAEQAQAVIAADNYGEAGAIDYYGSQMGLPSARCGCGTYWFFGPGTLPGSVLVNIGTPAQDLRQLYGDVREVARLRDPWAVPEEQDVPITVSREPNATLQQVWPTLDPRKQ
jgi:hypothetical protein